MEPFKKKAPLLMEITEIQKILQDYSQRTFAEGNTVIKITKTIISFICYNHTSAFSFCPISNFNMSIRFIDFFYRYCYLYHILLLKHQFFIVVLIIYCYTCFRKPQRGIMYVYIYR